MCLAGPQTRLVLKLNFGNPEALWAFRPLYLWQALKNAFWNSELSSFVEAWLCLFFEAMNDINAISGKLHYVPTRKLEEWPEIKEVLGSILGLFFFYYRILSGKQQALV